MAGARRERIDGGSLSPRTAGRPIPRREQPRVNCLRFIVLERIQVLVDDFVRMRRKGFGHPRERCELYAFVLHVHVCFVQL
ncbi:hypothetical protein V6N13_078256 [Hibiscus sabdariffa]|uniref:Uncharacterized protein n=1 Tax=Hibiscus sabdariffa TaxID=183260 RepID=A0ABR2RNM5_9ROSI